MAERSWQFSKARVLELLKASRAELLAEHDAGNRDPRVMRQANRLTEVLELLNVDTLELDQRPLF